MHSDFCQTAALQNRLRVCGHKRLISPPMNISAASSGSCRSARNGAGAIPWTGAASRADASRLNVNSSATSCGT